MANGNWYLVLGDWPLALALSPYPLAISFGSFTFCIRVEKEKVHGSALLVLHHSKSSAIRFRRFRAIPGDSGDLHIEPFPPRLCLTLWLPKLKRELDN